MLNKVRKFLYQMTPLLYLFVRFAILTVAVGLFISDFYRAAGIVAAVGLYYIVDAKQKQETEEMYFRMLQKAGMEEEKRYE